MLPFTVLSTVNLGSIIGPASIVVDPEKKRKHPKVRFDALIMPPDGTKPSQPCIVEADALANAITLYRKVAASAGPAVAYDCVTLDKALVTRLKAKAVEASTPEAPVTSGDLWSLIVASTLDAAMEAAKPETVQPLRDAVETATEQVALALLALAGTGELDKELTPEILRKGMARAMVLAVKWGRKANGEFHLGTPKGSGK